MHMPYQLTSFKDWAITLNETDTAFIDTSFEPHQEILKTDIANAGEITTLQYLYEMYFARLAEYSEGRIKEAKKKESEKR